MSDTANHPIARAMRAQQSGQVEEAFDILTVFLQEQPNDPDARQFMGILLAQSGKSSQALPHLKQSSDNAPHRSDYALNTAQIAASLNDHATAAEAYRRVTLCAPNTMEGWLGLGTSLAALNQHEQAREVFAQGIEHLPENASLRNALGVQLKRDGDLDGAEASFRASLDLYNQGAAPWYNLGNTLLQLHRPDEADKAFTQALKITPTYAEAHAHKGMAFMMKGDFTHGWPEYEWRWQGHNFPNQQADAPLWDGSALKGQTLLLTTEQGFGDAFQFAQFIPQVAQRSEAHIIVSAQAPLVELFQSVEGVDEVFARNTPLPAFQAQAPLMTLPFILSTALEDLPTSPTPYMTAPPHSLSKWAQRVKNLPGRKVGLAWRGNPEQAHNLYRSCHSQHLKPLLDVEEASFVCLQTNATPEELATLSGIHNFGAEFQDFSDTAAVMSQLDLIISVCTSTAHLAGALNRPTWVMLSAASDWRWFIDRDDSPWYPSAHLFRQSKLHDWNDVIHTVRQSLSRLSPLG